MAAAPLQTTIGNGRPTCNPTYNNNTRVSNREETVTNCLLAKLQVNQEHKLKNVLECNH